MSSILLGLNVVGLLLVVLCIGLLIKNRQYEKSVFETSVNVLLFGLLLLALVKLVDVLVLLNTLYTESFGFLDGYLGSFVAVSNVALLPLFGVCVLVSVLSAREGFENLS
ncbi:hypothetical protein HN992_02665 [Candidatus Woesearchaeota archaeon]|jgi:hypothetical protein|nr:hypothetical protein [Candidatus Woesearchaeota archaeon]MBT4058062.1 hypothetical protein [Candidatus Woesearchaeota archaeon]MBT4783275.1 hypothetical protein [Candidatus Woesearchaeota archaeon]MBT6941320.1 hypothetical protein [Candidatus Woesearchaeota archaeon]MBT7555684.1 hypothetical protein [Candidatus Woesearchaeota archaeon]